MKKVFIVFSILIVVTVIIFVIKNTQVYFKTLSVVSSHNEITITSDVNLEINSNDDGNLFMVIHNHSDDIIIYSHFYELEKSLNGIWYAVPFKEDYFFTTEQLYLYPNKSVEHKIDKRCFDYYLNDGKYRVLTQIVHDETIVYIADEFELKNGCVN